MRWVGCMSLLFEDSLSFVCPVIMRMEKVVAILLLLFSMSLCLRSLF